MGQGRQVVIKAAGMDRLDGLRHPAVERHSPGRGHLVVERGPDQRVAEAVSASHLGDEPGMDGFLQRGEPRFLSEVTGHPDDGRVKLEADGRRHPQRPIGGVGEAGEAPAHDVTDPQ
jgi:hypothetical protein